MGLRGEAAIVGFTERPATAGDTPETERVDGQQRSLVAPTSLMLERGEGHWLISVMQSSPLADD